MQITIIVSHPHLSPQRNTLILLWRYYVDYRLKSSRGVTESGTSFIKRVNFIRKVD
jgi:hypothetical protein